MKDFTMGAMSGSEKIPTAPQESETKTWKNLIPYFLVFFCLGSTGLYAQQPAASIEQVRNGSADAPLISPLEVNWQNGNLGPTQAHYFEGSSVPYRAVMTNMPAGPAFLIIEYDIMHSGKHALDYLTHYDRIFPHMLAYGHPQEDIDPLIGYEFLGDATVYETDSESIDAPITNIKPDGINLQPLTSFNSLAAAGREITIWNGNITDVINVGSAQGSLTVDKSSQQVRINFIVDEPGTVILAWGGHIANRNDWDYGDEVVYSAGGISGSPYHMRLIDWPYGNLGNQDRSLKASAVIPAPTCVLPQDTEVCEGAKDVAYSVTPINSEYNPQYNWTIEPAAGETSTDATWSATNSTNPPSGTTVYVDAGSKDFVVKLSIVTDFGNVECEAPTVVNAGPVLKDATASFCDDDQSDTTLSDYDDDIQADPLTETVVWYKDINRTPGQEITKTGDLAASSSPYVYYARVTNNTTKCDSDAKLSITIDAAPVLKDATASFCDDDQSDTTLSDYDDDIQADPLTETVVWYKDINRTPGQEITKTGDLAASSSPYVYYARVTNNTTKCDSDAKLSITIDAAPVLKDATASFCDDDQSDTTLSDYDDDIQADPLTETVVWYKDINRTPGQEITKTGDLAASSSPYVYYARVTNNTTKCDSDAKLSITIDAAPVLKDATASFCDDDQSDTTLSDYDDDIQADPLTETVVWYKDINRTPGQEITKTGDLAASSSPYVYYARVTNNTTKCDSDAKLSITIDAAPVLKDATASFCDDDQSDTTLSDYDDDIQADPLTETVVWYKDINRTPGQEITKTGDLAASSSPYVYYARVTNNTTKCDSDAKLSITIDAAPVLKDATASFCDDDQSDTTLSDYDDDIQADPLTETVVWYKDINRTPGQEITKTGDLAASSSPYVYYARVTNNTTKCDSDAKLSITIDAAPVLKDATASFCDDDQSDTTLSDYDDDIQADPLTETVVWYKDINRTPGQEITKTGDLAASSSPYVYYARVTNNTTKCDSDAKLTITINANPSPSVANQSACVGDNVTFTNSNYKSSVESYVWKVDKGDGNGFVNISPPETGEKLILSSVSTAMSGYKYQVIATGASPTNCQGSDSASLTVENCAHIFPTQTTCCNYLGGNPQDFVLSYVCSTLDNRGKISNAIPGVFFYYADFTAETTGTVIIVVNQTNDQGLKAFDPQNANNVRVFVDDCQSVNAVPTIGKKYGSGNVAIEFDVIAGKTYVISVKYDVKSIIGSSPSGDNDYSFSLSYEGGSILSGSTGIVTVKAGCSDTSGTPYGSCPPVESSILSTSTQSIQAESLSVESVASDVAVYPIPFSDVINIDYQFDYSSDVVIEIFDLGGNLLRTLKDSNVSRGSTTSIAVDFSISANQMYMVRVTTERETFVKQIVSSKK